MAILSMMDKSGTEEKVLSFIRMLTSTLTLCDFTEIVERTEFMYAMRDQWSISGCWEVLDVVR